MSKSNRYPFLDFLRGIAVVLMIFFHLFYDLSLFNFVTIDFFKDPFWFWLPRLIVFLFLICVGMGQAITHEKKISYKKATKRGLKIGLLAVAFSVVTYILFPTKWIVFGTLHCIALSSLIILPFLKKPKICAIIAISIFISFYLIKFITGGYFFIPPSPNLIFKIVSMDYIPIYPWCAVAFLGVTLKHFNFHLVQVPKNLSFYFEYWKEPN